MPEVREVSESLKEWERVATHIKPARGMHADLLDRQLIINTKPYEKGEIKIFSDLKKSTEYLKEYEKKFLA